MHFCLPWAFCMPWEYTWDSALCCSPPWTPFCYRSLCEPRLIVFRWYAFHWAKLPCTSVPLSWCFQNHKPTCPFCRWQCWLWYDWDMEKDVTEKISKSANTPVVELKNGICNAEKGNCEKGRYAEGVWRNRDWYYQRCKSFWTAVWLEVRWLWDTLWELQKQKNICMITLYHSFSKCTVQEWKRGRRHGGRGYCWVRNKERI